jgi:predicted HTH transcriptional regulator
MTYGVLKSIAGFLNTEGGNLLIGVADDGSIVGADIDQFPNRDKYLLHLMELIRSRMGQHAATHVTPTLHSVENAVVCLVECSKSSEPVFYRKSKDTDEEFFVRTGPKTDRLQPSAILTYVRARFGEQHE